MVTLNAHFDGKAIILDEPLPMSLRAGARLKVTVQSPDESATPSRTPKNGPKAGSAKGKVKIAPDFDTPLEDFSEYTK